MYGYIKQINKLNSVMFHSFNPNKNESEYIYTNMKSAVAAEILEIEEKAYTEADIWVITKKR